MVSRFQQTDRASAAHTNTSTVDGINGNPATLKFILRVTQGHWKRNHWIDHTQFTISWVIWRWILSWPWIWVRGQSSRCNENGIIQFSIHIS